MTAPRKQDDLTLRYHEASAQEARRPAERVREAVRAHAKMLAAARQAGAPPVQPPSRAANQTRWKVSMLASVMLACLTGLLVLQFDRGTPEERQLVSGPPLPAVAPLPGGVPAQQPGPAPSVPPVAADKGAVRKSADAATLPSPDKSEPAAAASSARARANPQPSVSNRPAPEPFPAAPPSALSAAPFAGPAAAPAALSAESRPEAPAQAESDMPPQSAGRVASKAEAPPPAPGRPAAIASPGPLSAPLPATAVEAEAMQARRSARLADTLVQKKSDGGSLLEGASLTAPRLAPLARSVRDPLLALQEAARAGQLLELERLIAQGVPINAPDDAGRTPLMLAVINGRADVVRRLLAAGANRALLDREGLNALQHARKLGLEQIAAMIEAGS